MEKTEEKKILLQAVKGKVPKHDIPKADGPKINHVSVNQTQEYFAIATEKGFEIV
jgi:Flp pilus assembly CpaF family ATPase